MIKTKSPINDIHVRFHEMLLDLREVTTIESLSYKHHSSRIDKPLPSIPYMLVSLKGGRQFACQGDDASRLLSGFTDLIKGQIDSVLKEKILAMNPPRPISTEGIPAPVTTVGPDGTIRRQVGIINQDENAQDKPKD